MGVKTKKNLDHSFFLFWAFFFILENRKADAKARREILLLGTDAVYPRVDGSNVQFRYNTQTHLLVIGGMALRLTPTEALLFQALASPTGHTVPLKTLSERNNLTSKLVRQHISRLRRKLWSCEIDIECVHSKGYRLSSLGVPEKEPYAQHVTSPPQR